MKVKALLVACCLLLPVASTAGQTADPVSGKWGKDGQTLLDLMYDGKGAVTGTIMAGRPGNLAPIRTGTFDPSTGALKLQGEAKDPDTGAAMPYVIEGKLANGALGVTAAFGGDYKGDFALTKLAPAPGGAPADVSPAAKSFAEVSDWITRSAEMVPADKYSYRPAPTVRTFGQIVGHVADAYNYYCAQASGKKVQWSDPIEKGTTDKAMLASKLKQATDTCTATYASGGDLATLVENVGHTNLHYGNMITYIRMLGLVPPSSR